MSIQKADNLQINKCPHGFAVGTCPICNGSMSAKTNKDKNKPRVKGEMSYNECLLAWHKIQAMKEAKLKERMERLSQIKEQSRLDRLNQKLLILKTSIQNYVDKLNNIHKTLSNLNVLKPVQIAIKAVINVIKASLNIVIFLTNSISFVFNLVSNVVKFTLSAAQKLSSFAREIFAEINQMIKESFSKAKKAIKTILSLFCQSEQKEKDDDKKRKKLKEIFKKVRKKLDEN